MWLDFTKLASQKLVCQNEQIKGAAKSLIKLQCNKPKKHIVNFSNSSTNGFFFSINLKHWTRFPAKILYYDSSSHHSHLAEFEDATSISNILNNENTYNYTNKMLIKLLND